ELARLLLEAADQQHLAVVAEQLLGAGAAGLGSRLRGRLGRGPRCHRLSLLPIHGRAGAWFGASRWLAGIYTVSDARHSRRDVVGYCSGPSSRRRTITSF